MSIRGLGINGNWHRFLGFVSQQQLGHLSGVVEADETFVRLSFQVRRKPFTDDEITKIGTDKRLYVPVLISMSFGSRLTRDGQLTRKSTIQITDALRIALVRLPL